MTDTTASEPIQLYELVGAEGRRFSPYCWRVRMALEHKRLPYTPHPVPFTRIGEILDGRRRSVPAIRDGGRILGDSWAIADYLEATYPDSGSPLFGGAEARTLTHFLNSWIAGALHAPLARLMIRDIHDHVAPEDRAYFRESREARFGRTLEEVQAGREEDLPRVHAALAPLDSALRERSFLGGHMPGYADYIVFGAMQWARSCTDCRILPAHAAALHAWLERMLDLYDGLARKHAAYWPTE